MSVAEFQRGLEQGYGSSVSSGGELWARSREQAQELGLKAHDVGFELGVRAQTQGLEAQEVVGWLEGVDLEGLVLAVGWTRAPKKVMQVVDERYGREIRGVLSRYAKTPGDVDDLYQLFCERVFLEREEEQGARFLEYSGRGKLKNWLRVTAVRLGINQSKSAARVACHEVLVLNEEQVLSASDHKDVEMELIKQKSHHAFKKAFAQAVLSLTPEERNLLRQYFVGRLSIDQLGQLYQIHRATAARRLAQVRKRLMEETRAALRLDLGGAAFESILELLQSRMDVSLSRLLRPDEAMES